MTKRKSGGKRMEKEGKRNKRHAGETIPDAD
jgi:hypothetical protein